MHTDAVLPAFELDCRDWIVVRPEDIDARRPKNLELLVGEDAGPTLAVLSTAIIDDDRLSSVTGVLSLAMLDAMSPPAVPVEPDGVAEELLDLEGDRRLTRFVLRAPDSDLAVLAEFRVDGGRTAEDLGRGAPADGTGEAAQRVQALMRSFRWAA